MGISFAEVGDPSPPKNKSAKNLKLWREIFPALLRQIP